MSASSASAASCEEPAKSIAGGITALTSLAYLTFYTPYCAKTKSLSFTLLQDVVLVRRGAEFTLTELNRLISLTGITLIGLAFAPRFEVERAGLLRHAHALLWAHTVYSVCKCCVTGSIKSLGGVRGIVPIKVLSLILGAAAQLVLWRSYSGSVEWEQLLGGLFTLVAGAAHQYTMAIDKKGVARMRPFGHAPLIVTWLVVSWSMTFARIAGPDPIYGPREDSRGKDDRLRDGPINKVGPLAAQQAADALKKRASPRGRPQKDVNWGAV